MEAPIIRPAQQPEFSLQRLQQYLALMALFTGKDPKEITVSKQCLDWYEKTAKDVAKNMNIPTTKNYKEFKYLGVTLNAI